MLGGMGSPIGALVGGLLLGLIEALTAGYICSVYKDAVAFIVILVVLFVMPSGIFGRVDGPGVIMARMGTLLHRWRSFWRSWRSSFSPFFPSNYYYRVGSLIFVNGLAVIGMVILIGYAGQISLGHAGFVGIGAYACALAPIHLGLPPWLPPPRRGDLAALAWAVGRPVLRLKGYYLAVATLGLGILVSMVLANEAWLTKGPDGIEVPVSVLFGRSPLQLAVLVLHLRPRAGDRRLDRAQPLRQPDRPRAARDPRHGDRRPRARHRRRPPQAPGLRDLGRLRVARGIAARAAGRASSPRTSPGSCTRSSW